MATRGDLLIKTRDQRGVDEWNRFLITSDAYLDGAGMKDRITRALQKVNRENISMSVALSEIDPRRYILENKDMQGGYTYEIDMIKETIHFGYRGSNEYSWDFTLTLDEFIEDAKTENDYRIEFENAILTPTNWIDVREEWRKAFNQEKKIVSIEPIEDSLNPNLRTALMEKKIKNDAHMNFGEKITSLGSREYSESQSNNILEDLTPKQKSDIERIINSSLLFESLEGDGIFASNQKFYRIFPNETVKRESADWMKAVTGDIDYLAENFPEALKEAFDALGVDAYDVEATEELFYGDTIEKIMENGKDIGFNEDVIYEKFAEIYSKGNLANILGDYPEETYTTDDFLVVRKDNDTPFREAILEEQNFSIISDDTSIEEKEYIKETILDDGKLNAEVIFLPSRMRVYSDYSGDFPIESKRATSFFSYEASLQELKELAYFSAREGVSHVNEIDKKMEINAEDIKFRNCFLYDEFDSASIEQEKGEINYDKEEDIELRHLALFSDVCIGEMNLLMRKDDTGTNEYPLFTLETSLENLTKGVQEEEYKRMKATIKLAKAKDMANQSKEENQNNVSYIVFAGSSGAGKSKAEKVTKELHSEKANLSISATSRKPRSKNGKPTEEHGKDYYFLNGIESFEDTPMLESEILKMKDNSLVGYGTPLLGVTDTFAEGKHIILSLDPDGAETLKKNFPNTVICLFDPPKEEILAMAKKTMKDASPEDIEANTKRLERLDIKGKAEKLGLFDDAKVWYSPEEEFPDNKPKTFLVNEYLTQSEFPIFVDIILKEASRVGASPKEAIAMAQELSKKQNNENSPEEKNKNKKRKRP